MVTRTTLITGIIVATAIGILLLVAVITGAPPSEDMASRFHAW
jgi:hypothetical protein